MTNTAVVYGDSLYDLAAEEKLTDDMLEEINGVCDIFNANPDYRRLLGEPSVSKETRLGLIDEAFKGKIQPYLLNFLKILCENGLLGELSGCTQQFRKRYNADHGIAEAIVTSASGLSASQAEALKEKLEKISGRTIVLTQKVDSRLIAGVRVELEGKQYDSTALGRLSALRRQVTEIIV